METKNIDLIYFHHHYFLYMMDFHIHSNLNILFHHLVHNNLMNCLHLLQVLNIYIYVYIVYVVNVNILNVGWTKCTLFSPVWYTKYMRCTCMHNVCIIFELLVVEYFNYHTWYIYIDTYWLSSSLIVHRWFLNLLINVHTRFQYWWIML